MKLRNACSLVVTVALGACNCQLMGPLSVGYPTITIDSPANGASFAPSETLTFHVTAYDETGLSSILLEAGGGDGGPVLTSLAMCRAPDEAWGTPPSKATCEYTFSLADHADLVSNGTLLLTAVAMDRRDKTKSASVTVNVSGLTCLFVAPASDGGIAPVGSDTSVIVEVVDEASRLPDASLPILEVKVTSDDGPIDFDWPSNGELDAGSAPGTWFVRADSNTWGQSVGAGIHTLQAVVTTDNQGINSCTIRVNVGCATDSDCSSTDRCCPQDGTCNPIVADGADCDCQHPCQTNEGCFPGICDGSSLKCRAPCSLGSDGTPPATCAEQNGMPAACLPTAQQLMADGVCTTGDNCNPITQNCPNLPLDRSMPASMLDGGVCIALSATCPNPTVPQNCIPVASGVNACFPAGSIPIGGTGCNQACGQVEGNCVQGGICTVVVDDNGNPTGPPTCDQIQM